MKARMSTFVEYLAASGTSKLTKVTKARREAEQEYKRGTDYWGPLRTAIVGLLVTGGDPATLFSILPDVPPDRHTNYTRVIDAFIAWMGRKKFEWVGVSKGGLWHHGELTIPVRADLGLEWGGKRRVIRLHFGASEISRVELASIVALLTEMYPDREVAVLDIRRKKLHAPKPKPQMQTVLRAEASSFIELWHALDTPPSATGT